MTTIKQFTDSNIIATEDTIDLKIIKVKAATEHLVNTHNSLYRDREMVQRIHKLLNLLPAESVLDFTPTTIVTVPDNEIHTSYLILLASTILRSGSSENNEIIRARFALPEYLVTVGSCGGDNLKALRAKYINLLDLHGPISTPNVWVRLLAKIQSWFKQVPEAV